MLPSFAFAEVQTGSQIPTTLALTDQNGTAQDFEKLKGKNGLILVFVRSADWCPYCQAQLKDLKKEHQNFRALGFNLASVSYDSVATLQAFSKKNNIAYPMLSDVTSETIKSFDILNTQFAEGSRFYGVPHPHVYIISNTGKITAILKEAGYKDRPEISDIINAAKESISKTP